MRRLLLLSALTIMGGFLFSSTATAQSGADGGFNCVDFATQGEAQGFFNNDPSDPEGLDADNDGLACEDSLPSDGGDEMMEAPAEAAVNCDGFASQFGAQQFFDFNATPQEQAILDPDGNGFACDGGTIEVGEDAVAAPEQYTDGPIAEEPVVEEPVATAPSEPMTALPDTSGPALLPVAVLLIGAGLIGLRVIRKS